MTALPAPRTLTSPSAVAEVFDHGAHVVSWTPVGTAPVLWMSAASAFETGAPIRGGVPICFPWFGAGRSKDCAPAHGFARLQAWRFLGEERTPEAVRGTWELAGDGTSAGFAYPFRATYEVRAGASLDLRLTVTNTGTETFSYEEALHTYLAVGDVRQVVVDGLDGASYLDKAAGADAGPHRQQGPVTISAETDRVYASTGEVRLTDPVWERTLTVTKTGSATTVVWNPWVAKAAAMPDFGDDEWPGMICIEAANALDDAVVLAPGESHTLGYLLTVS